MAHRILLVDDNPGHSMAVVSYLKDKGFETFHAMDAISATIMAQKHSPDLLILDFQLPGGTGLMVYERLRMIRGIMHLPAIFLSGYVERAREALPPDSPHLRFLKKPTNFDELLASVRYLLKIPEAPPPPSAAV